MHPAYFEVRFRCNELCEAWPSEFIIVTAFATTGENWSHERNQSANDTLESRLQELGVWHHPITGYSPQTSHAEPGFAVALGLSAGLAIGREFHQDAIYHVGGDALRVVTCQIPECSEYVASFQSRLDP